MPKAIYTIDNLFYLFRVFRDFEVEGYQYLKHHIPDETNGMGWVVTDEGFKIIVKGKSLKTILLKLEAILIKATNSPPCFKFIR
jgi:hypothetical protein